MRVLARPGPLREGGSCMVGEQADVVEQTCPARDVLDRVGDKWSVYVITSLGEGTKRFNELLRQIDGISQRMLTVTLRGLERDGLVQRTVHAEVPVRVEYRLTEMGHTLLRTVESLLSWSQRHTGDIQAARQRYDERQPPG